MTAREVAEKIVRDLQALPSYDGSASIPFDRFNKLLSAITAELESRDKRIERLREALQKFADFAHWNGDEGIVGRQALDALNADSGDV